VQRTADATGKGVEEGVVMVRVVEPEKGPEEGEEVREEKVEG
jgi:hypothetical protein